MDCEMLRSVKYRGRSLERSHSHRRKRIHSGRRSSSRRSSSRRSKHHNQGLQSLSSGQMKPLKVVSMLAMMAFSPFFIIFMWYTVVKADGSVEYAYKHFYHQGYRAFVDVWPYPSLRAWKMVLSFVAFEACLQVLVPGKRIQGSSAHRQDRPVHTKNGVSCFLTTLSMYYFIWREKWFDPAQVYDIIGEIYSVLLCTTYTVSSLLFIKGYFSPSSGKHSSGNVLADYFWGLEPHPKLTRSLDIKVLIRCRLGIMGWAILIVSFAIKQHDSRGQVSDSLMVVSGLMLIYITKFFCTESACWFSMQSGHSRAGWFMTFTCLTWIPVAYSSVNLHLVTHPIQLGKGAATIIFLFGLFCIYCRQRQLFHDCHGKCRIWGGFPSKSQGRGFGQRKKGLFFTAGLWGLTRHFQ